MYRLYIDDDRHGKMWLLDWIEACRMDHPQFTCIFDHAMTFERFDACFQCRKKLSEMGYLAHMG